MHLLPHHSASQADKNFFHLVGDVLWFGIALAATSRFMSVYAIRLDATPLAQSLIVSLPGLVLGFSAFFAAWWRNRFQKTDQAVRLPGIIFRFVFLLPAFAPFFPHDFQVVWLVLAVALPAIPQGIAGVIFMTFMRESIGDSKWDIINTRRFLGMNIGIAIGALGFGLMLTKVPFPYNYQLMFVIAFCFSMVSYYHVYKTRSIYPTPKPEVTADKVTPLHKLPGFRRVIVGIVVAHLTFLSVNAVVPLALVERLGAQEGFIALYGMSELMGGVAFGLFGHKITHRLGSKRTSAIFMCLTALTPLMTAVSPVLGLTLIGGFAAGLGWTGTITGLLAQLVEKTPSHAMPRASARWNQLAAIGIFFGPLIGGLLANSGVDLSHVLLFGVTLRLTGGIVLGAEQHMFRDAWYFVTHPRLAFAHSK